MNISGVAISILGFLAVIGPLIFLHELGHYAVGRLFGVKADAFSIGMGRELFGWTDRRGTRWRVAALPIGGYVKFAGDMNAGSQPSPEWLMLPPEERARTFQAKPLWQRFLIVLAGPATNFAVAILIFAAFYATTGVPRTPPVIESVMARSPAATVGLRAGDRIVAIDGVAVDSFEDVTNIVRLHPGDPIAYRVVRDGRELGGMITPMTDQIVDRHGAKTPVGVLGVVHGPQQVVRVGLPEAGVEAVRATGDVVRLMADLLGQIVTGNRSTKDLGGPLKVAQYSGDSLAVGWDGYIAFLALISINLGFMNLLPIPMLDGGHLFFYVLEAVRRRPLPERAQEWAFRSGLALVLAFMMIVTINDLGAFGLWRGLAGLIG